MKSAIAAHREATGKTLEQLGNEFGVNKTTIMRWEESGVPINRFADAERITGISRAKLRPDIFGPAGPAPSSEAAA